MIPALLADPTGELSAFYGLLPLADTVTAEALGLLVGDRIRRVTGRLGGRTSTGARGELGPDGGREVALSLPFIEPGTVTEGGRIDLRLRVLSSADTGESGERGPGIELELPDWEPITFSLGGRTLAFDTTSLPDVLFVGRDGADTGGAGPVEISVEAQPRTDRRLVIGGATGLDLSWPVLRLSLEAEDEVDYGVELVSRGSKVAIKAGEGDSFLRALIAGLDFEVEFDLGLEWSRSRGLTLSGTAALENRIALNLSLGPLSLTWLDLILALDGDVIRFSTGSELELRFEPFDVTIEGLGAEATLDFASETRNLGFCDLRLVFRPPTRIVLVIDSDVVTGGGFVLIDPIAGRYAGGLALDAFGVGHQRDRHRRHEAPRGSGRLRALREPRRDLPDADPARVRVHADRGRRAAGAPPHDRRQRAGRGPPRRSRGLDPLPGGHREGRQGGPGRTRPLVPAEPRDDGDRPRGRVRLGLPHR